MTGADAIDLSDNPTADHDEAVSSADVLGAALDGRELGEKAFDGLQQEDLHAEGKYRNDQYRRLVEVYRHGLLCSRDRDARLRFFAQAYWAGHVGERPDPRKHGPDDAIRFAVMRVCGGHNRERNQRASMIARACSYLAHTKVPPETLVQELKRKRGPKMAAGFKVLSDLEAERARIKCTGEDNDPSGSSPRLKKVSVILADGVSALDLPQLYVMVDDGALVLTTDPDQLIPFLLESTEKDAD